MKHFTFMGRRVAWFGPHQARSTSPKPTLLIAVIIVALVLTVLPTAQTFAAPTPTPVPTPTQQNTTTNTQQAGTTSTVSGTSNTSTTTQESQPGGIYEQCTKAIVGPLEWIICPLLSLFLKSIEAGEKQINEFLDIDTGNIFYDNQTTGLAYHQAWNSFRLLALSLIVIAALIMVIAEAAGVELLSAYSIRKILPRLLFAAIFISLSWSVLELLVNLSNDAGHGVSTLISYPFRGLASDNAAVGAIRTGTGATVILGTIGFVMFEVVGMFTFALTGLLGIFIALGVLIIRELVLIFLVIFAPFAIACYILPNTQKIWGIWKDALTAVLIVFPVVSAMIAMGRAFAIVSITKSDAPSDAPSAIYSLVAMVAYVAPYFMMATAFRMAGGVMGTLTGMVNDPNRGMFDRLSKFRQNKWDYNANRLRTGDRFGENKFFTENESDGAGVRSAKRMANFLTGGVPGALNRTTAGVSTGWRGRFGLGGRGREAFDQMKRIEADNIMKQNRAIQEDDPALEAMTYASAAEARQGMRNKIVDGKRVYADSDIERAISAVQVSSGFGASQQLAAAQQLVLTGTGYVDIQDMAKTIARVSRGNTTTATSLSGFANALSKSKGRWELSPSFGTLNGLTQRLVAGQEVSQAEFDAATIKAVSDSTDAGTLARTSKAKVFENMKRVMDRVASNSGEYQAGIDKFNGALEQSIRKSLTGQGLSGNQLEEAFTKAFEAKKMRREDLDKNLKARIIETTQNEYAMTSENVGIARAMRRAADEAIKAQGQSYIDEGLARVYDPYRDPITGKPKVYSSASSETQASTTTRKQPPPVAPPAPPVE